MTDERLSQPDEGVWACPFIALEGDQDHRSDRPDYRHRCFAVGQPEPRALPHQERYCLTPAFTGCPMFLDWARQEAAATLAEPPSAPQGAGRGAFVGRAGTPEDAPAFLAGRPRSTGSVVTPAPTPPGAELAGGVWQPDVERREDARKQTATASNRAVTLDTTQLAATPPGQSLWDKPMPAENFPRLRPSGRRSGSPPLLLTTVALAVIMVALLVYPVLTSQKGGIGGGKTPAPTPTIEATPTPTPEPSPTCEIRIHIVQKNEYLQAIGTRYGIPWQDIAALNNISDPTKIYPNQKLKIPCAASTTAVPSSTNVPTLLSSPSMIGPNGT